MHRAFYSADCKLSRSLSTQICQKVYFSPGKLMHWEGKLGFLETWVDIYLFLPWGRRRRTTEIFLKSILFFFFFLHALCQQPSAGYYLNLTWLVTSVLVAEARSWEQCEPFTGEPLNGNSRKGFKNICLRVTCSACTLYRTQMSGYIYLGGKRGAGSESACMHDC